MKGYATELQTLDPLHEVHAATALCRLEVWKLLSQSALTIWTGALARRTGYCANANNMQSA